VQTQPLTARFHRLPIILIRELIILIRVPRLLIWVLRFLTRVLITVTQSTRGVHASEARAQGPRGAYSPPGPTASQLSARCRFPSMRTPTPVARVLVRARAC
jgi:hypothetical protein